MEEPAGNRRTGELVREVVDDVQLLVRKELELARVELTEGVKAQLKGGGLVALAVVAALPGLLFLVIALALWLPDVTALTRAGGFLVVGAGMLLFTVLGILIGIRVMRSRRPSVGPAVGRMKEDARWARDRLTR